MSLFDWFANREKANTSQSLRPMREIEDGLWTKCEACSQTTYTKDLRANNMVCLECGHHMRVFSDDRIDQIADEGSWRELNDHLVACDPLTFVDRKPYRDRLVEYQAKTCLLYTSPSPRDKRQSRMPSSA